MRRNLIGLGSRNERKSTPILSDMKEPRHATRFQKPWAGRVPSRRAKPGFDFVLQLLLQPNHLATRTLVAAIELLRSAMPLILI